MLSELIAIVTFGMYKRLHPPIQIIIILPFRTKSMILFMNMTRYLETK